jgi:hypothetical protein
VSDRIEEHCGTCGAAEEAGLQKVCSCPCHTHPDRRCGCGGVRRITSSRMGIKLNLKGEQSIHLIILEAECNTCKGVWKKQVH